MKFAFVIAALFAASAIAAPCGRKHVDDVSDVTDVPQVDDVPDVSTATPPVDSDTEDERKTSVDSNDNDGNSQTAVINTKSGEKGGKGSILNVDASNLLANGVLSNEKNQINQHAD